MSLLATGWPAARLGEAFAAAVHVTGPRQQVPNPRVALAFGQDVSPDAWLREAAAALEVDIRYVQLRCRDAARTVVDAAPCLLFPANASGTVLTIVRGRRGRVLVARPDGSRGWVSAATLQQELAAPLQAAEADAVERLLDAAEIGRRRRRRLVAHLIGERVGERTVGRLVTVRPSSTSRWVDQLRAAGALPQLAGFVAAHLASFGLLLLAWWWVGRALFEGMVDPGFVVGWPIVLAAIVPARMVAHWCSGLLSVSLATVFRQRLLLGAMRLDPQQARRLGVGRVVGNVIESTGMEATALTGALVAAQGLLELLVSIAAFAALGAWPPLVVLALVVLLAVPMLRTYRHRFGLWLTRRLELTLLFIENLAGHRTRLIDVPSERWHDREQTVLATYVGTSPALDWSRIRLWSLLPPLWLATSLVVIGGHSLVSDASPGQLAAAIGLAIMVQRALSATCVGCSQLVQASILWRRLSHLRARREPAAKMNAVEVLALRPRKSSQPVLEARGISFDYRSVGRSDGRSGGRRIVDGVDLVIERGDNVLLRGASGQGKSTLAALICGQVLPQSGIMLADALDHSVLGTRAWRRRFVLVPQFYKNHIYSETLAFNLLVGRGWPATHEELDEAERVCIELGLGPLLERMPAGLDTVVGDLGWQLSHGERARVFAARALLANADVVVFDESFAALDPVTLTQVMRCVRARSQSIVVVAHP